MIKPDRGGSLLSGENARATWALTVYLVQLFQSLNQTEEVPFCVANMLELHGRQQFT